MSFYNKTTTKKNKKTKKHLKKGGDFHENVRDVKNVTSPSSVPEREWAWPPHVATRGRPAPSCLGGQEGIILKMLEIGYIGKIQRV